MPEISIDLLRKGMADTLVGIYPDANIYANPNQQGTLLPAFFITALPSKITRHRGRWQRTVIFSIDYLEDYNLTNLTDRYTAVAEQLDIALEAFTANGATVRSYDRNWKVQSDMLNYLVTVKTWVVLPGDPQTTMQALEEVEVTPHGT